MSRKLVLWAFAALACGADEATGPGFDGPQPSAVCSAHNVCDTMDGDWDGRFGMARPGGRDSVHLNIGIVDEKSSFYTGVMTGAGVDLSINSSSVGVSPVLSGSRTESDFTLTLTFDTLATLTYEGTWQNDRAVGLLNGSMLRSLRDTLSGEIVFNDHPVTLARTGVTLN